MAKTAARWSMRKAFPPMRMVKFAPLEQRVIAEWMMAAGVTCDEDYHLSKIAEHARAFVIGQFKQQAEPHRLWVADLIHEEED